MAASLVARIARWTGRLALWLPAFFLTVLAALASPLKTDEQVVLFPTAAHLAEDGTHWLVPIHAWIFEPESDSALRNGLLAAAAASLRLGPGTAESEIFRERAAWFLVDNERNKDIALSLAQAEFTLAKSRPDGHLRAEITLARDQVPAEAVPFWLDQAVDPPQGDDRIFAGRVLFVPEEGLSVVSDIDDTVKLSQVTDKKALLENTFLKPFEPAPGVPSLYRELAGKGAAFHYVSSSPWQLYPPLDAFFERVGLPGGSFHLRSFRLKDESFLNLFKSSRETKPPVIEALLEAFPRRDFVLIGDSGEEDPEIYGEIARRHPGQVRAILIRKVTAEDATDPRYLDGAFKGLSPDLWLLFEEAEAARGFLSGRL